MIKINNLTYGYKKGNNILRNINLEIKENETVVIMGKNGSGKSTLGKLISGILKVKRGNIFIDGLDISDKKNKEKIINEIGIVFQNPENQIIFNNIEDELSFSLDKLDKKEKEEIIKDVLKKVHMEDKTNEDLYELSLGQKQRIVISEVLAKKPKYIIFDEPTTMIDSAGKEEIHSIIKELKKEEYTIIYITNMADEMLLADRIVIIENGEVVDTILKDELINKINILVKHGIKVPLIIQIVQALKEEGIDINLNELSTEELILKIKGIAKNEK